MCISTNHDRSNTITNCENRWLLDPYTQCQYMDGVQSLVDAQDAKLCSLIDKLASLLLELALDLL